MVTQANSEVSFPPKPAARRTLHAVNARLPSFATWFAQQMQRNDGVGQIARDCAGGRYGVQSFRELIESILWAGPSFTDDDIDAAVQARREYLAVNWERRT